MTVLPPRAKFEPAPQFVELLERPRLLARLDEGVRRRLTYVHAPAGYGKTSLLSAWVEARRARGEASIWVSLDALDAEPGAFLASLASALAGGGLIASTDEADAALPPAALAAKWSRQLESAGPVVLILDDFHVARTPETERLLRLLLDALPRSLHLVVSTRGRCDLPIAVLMAQGQLNDVGAAMLRFSPEEAATLLLPALGSREDAARCGQAAEGWPIAVRLMMLSTFAPSPEPGRPAPIPLTSEIRDYLRTEICDPLADDEKAFLLDIAEFEQVSPELVDAVRGRHDSSAILARLVMAGAPILPVEAGGRWHRPHGLLRDCLREQLAADPDRRIRINAAASGWFAASGDIAAAVRHAIAAGEADRAVALLEAAGIGKVGASQGMTPLRAMIETLPGSIVAGHPHVRLARAFLFAKDGRIREARELFRRLDDDDAPPASGSAFSRDKRFLAQLLAFYEDSPIAGEDVRQIEALAREAVEDAPWFVGWVNNLLFMMHFEQGGILGARVAAETALARYGDADNLYAQLIMQAHLGMLDLAEGGLQAAVERLRRAREAAVRAFPDDLALRGLIDVPLSDVLLEQDAIEEADRLIWPALDQIERHEGWADLFVRAYRTATRIALATQGAEAALPVLDRAIRTAAERGLGRLARYAEIRRFELLAGLPEPSDELDGLRERVALLAGDEAGWRERQLGLLALARDALRRGDGDEAARHVAGLEAELAAGGPRQFELHAAILRGLVQFVRNDLDGAAAALRLALGIGAAQGWRRAFLDEEELLASCLIKVAQHSGLSSFSPKISAFLTEILAWRRRDLEEPEAGAAHIFSQRELEVLRELSLGKANKVIARALRLSEATVKFHLGNVYTKLGVHNRLLAVAVARERLLID